MFMAKNREVTQTKAKTNYLTRTLYEGVSGAASDYERYDHG